MMSSLNKSSLPPLPAPGDLQMLRDLLGDIGPEVEQQLREQRPVSEIEFKLAEQERRRLMADREFVKKYFDGNREARRRMVLVNTILSSKVDFGS